MFRYNSSYEIQTLENIYETLCECNIMYGVELWGLDEAWKEVDRIHGRFCKKMLCLPRCVANGVAEKELGREHKRKGDVVGGSILATNNAYGHPRPGQTML
jgi:hypothetical protein